MKSFDANDTNKMTKDMLNHVLRPAKRLLRVPTFNRLEVDVWPRGTLAKCCGTIMGSGASLDLTTTIYYPITL